MQIRIIADSSQAAGTGSDVARVQAAGIPLKIVDGSGGGIMHNKYAIVVDGRTLITGSYNWSTTAEESNDENAVFIPTPVIGSFQSSFNLMWASR